MELVSRSDLERQGFTGFLPISHLREQLEVIPRLPGVYCIVWDGADHPEFLAIGTGGRFKGVDPNVEVETLARNWVRTSTILYIGKAASGTSGTRGLRKRLAEYLDFGVGRPVGHKGGRYIWQIKNSASLLVCWKLLQEPPEGVETEMLKVFRSSHGQRPFANLRD